MHTFDADKTSRHGLHRTLSKLGSQKVQIWTPRENQNGREKGRQAKRKETKLRLNTHTHTGHGAVLEAPWGIRAPAPTAALALAVAPALATALALEATLALSAALALEADLAHQKTALVSTARGCPPACLSYGFLFV